MNDVWIVSGSAKAGKNHELHGKADEVYVSAFVPTENIEDSIRLAREAMKQHDLTSVDFDQVVRYEEDDLHEGKDPETQAEEQALREHAKRAADQDEVVCVVHWWAEGDQ